MMAQGARALSFTVAATNKFAQSQYDFRLTICQIYITGITTF